MKFDVVFHYQLWAAIDALAARHSLTPSTLAKKAGLDATALSKAKRLYADGRLHWLSTQSLARVLFVTKTPFLEFAKLAASQGYPTETPDASV